MFFKIIVPSVENCLISNSGLVIFHLITYLTMLNRSGLTANIEIKELNIMLELYWGEDLDVIFNNVIFISKWEIWKIRNKVKYNQSGIGDQTIFNTNKNKKST
jgi:hypothetical protein